MLKKLAIIFALSFFLFALRANAVSNQWDIGNTFIITAETIKVYKEPNVYSEPLFTLYKEMEIKPSDSFAMDGYKWFKLGVKDYWIPAIEPGGIVNVATLNNHKSQIKDAYGILNRPHNFAVKFVKYPGAVGRIETYKKINGEYVLQHTYTATYSKEGQKSRPDDLKTAGGNVVRYLFRTNRSLMTGWAGNGEPFGVYKVSFPMPHDALEPLLNGRISLYEYNEIPVISTLPNGELTRHPLSRMGGDVALHTDEKGSSGCINIENEAMSRLYHEDLVTENDREIIPFIIYDEEVKAPPIGQLLVNEKNPIRSVLTIGLNN